MIRTEDKGLDKLEELLSKDWKAALQDARTAGTETTYRQVEEHFRTRKGVQFFFGQEGRERGSGLTTKMKALFPNEVSRTLEMADYTSKWQFPLSGNPPEAPYLQIDRHTINWAITPNGHREGLFSLNRMRWFIDLGKAYWYTGDEHYAEACADQLERWIDANPVPTDGECYTHNFSLWRCLESGLRLRYWMHALYYFLGSPHWDGRLLAKLAVSVHEHCEHTMRNVNILTHNHTLMEMEGLLYGAVCFPELDRADVWRKFAVETLEECARRQVYADGIQAEAVPGYHNSSIMMFAVPYLLGKLNGIRFSEPFERTLTGMFEFSKYNHRPNGECVPIGDSDVIGEYSRGFLAAFGYYSFGMDHLEPFMVRNEALGWLLPSDYLEASGSSSADRARGELGSSAYDWGPASKAFPNGGFYCLQSGWEKDALYALMHCGPLVYGHAHADLLHFDLYYHSKALLTEVGKHTYNFSTDRRHAKSTSAHNTIVIDGENQADFNRRMLFVESPPHRLNRWEIGDRYVMADAEHDGYKRLGNEAVHRRQLVMLDNTVFVVIDRITGQGEHDDIEQFWHVNSTNVRLDSSRLAARSDDADSPNLQIIPLLTDKLKAETAPGWTTGGQGTKKPLTIVKYWTKGMFPVTFVTLLVPSKPGEDRQVRVRSFRYDERAVDLDFIVNDKRYAVNIGESVEWIDDGSQP